MSTPKRTLLRLAGVLALLLAILVVWPAPIDPLPYIPPRKPPLAGALAPNDALAGARLLAKGRLRGPEDVALDSQGRVYAGTADGRIVRLRGDGTVEEFARTAGRPLGLRFAPDGNLIVCDARKGLLSVDPRGRVGVLATEADGVPLGFADGIDVSRDGTIYFSDASWEYGQDHYMYDLLEARPHGRLIRYDPAAKSAKVLLGDLFFANGVALSTDESFVLVSETYRYRVTRYWLTGPRAGVSEVFADNLPGFPDGISSSGKGVFWLALFTLRDDLLDAALHPYPRVKSLLAKLPKSLWPKPRAYGLIVALDEQGRILRSLHDPSGQHVRQITTAREHDGVLYFGTLEDDWIGQYAPGGRRP